MIALLIACLSAALGASPALTVERARVAIELDDPPRGAELALEAARGGAPDARAVYLQALVAAGLGDRALVEVEAVEPVALPWADALDALDGALAAADVKGTVAAARELEKAFPEHPELLAGLWDMPAVPAALRRHRQAHAGRVGTQVKRRAAEPSESDLVYAYRARQLLLAAGQSTDDLALLFDAAGEPAVPLEPPRPLAVRIEQAVALSNQPTLELPSGRPGEVADLLDRVGEVALREHRHPRALEAWTLLEEQGDTVEAVEGRAKALLADGRRDEALAALDAGMGVAVEPWADDVAVVAAERRAVALVQLLDLRAEILVEGHALTAIADRATADLLAGRTELSPVEKRARTTGIAAVEALRDTYAAPAAETALRQAEAALDAGDHAQALKHAAATVVLFAWSDMADWRLDCARAHAVQARALEHLDDLEAARLAWEVALLLRPEAPEAWWAQAAEVQRRLGATEAAFARHATAHARSGSWDDLSRLEPLHRGPAPTEAAARAMAIGVPPPSSRDQVTVRRGVQYRFDGARTLEGREAGQGSDAPVIGTVPALGSRMPAWSAQSTTGPLVSGQLQGRAVVLVFWVADCASCLQALSETGRVARDLRGTGRDVAVVAVSMDQEERAFDELQRLDRVRVTLAHDPALGYRLGVKRAPTLYIVDAGGTLRYASVGWQGTGAFERALRRALSE